MAAGNAVDGAAHANETAATPHDESAPDSYAVSDEAFQRQLLDHLVFSDPAIQRAIDDGEE